MRDFMAVAKALADETRVRLLIALDAGGELCVCQLIEFSGLAPSTVSKHLSILKSARLLDSRKVGRWNFYRFPEGNVPQAVCGALRWVKESLGQDAQALAERERVQAVLKMDPEELCRKQCCR